MKMRKVQWGLLVLLLMLVMMCTGCSSGSSYSSNNYDRKYSNDEIHDFVNNYPGKW